MNLFARIGNTHTKFSRWKCDVVIKEMRKSMEILYLTKLWNEFYLWINCTHANTYTAMKLYFRYRPRTTWVHWSDKNALSAQKHTFSKFTNFNLFLWNLELLKTKFFVKKTQHKLKEPHRHHSKIELLKKTCLDESLNLLKSVFVPVDSRHTIW